MLNFMIWLFAGGIVGWLASRIMRTNRQQSWLTNIVVGIIGAFVGGLILGSGNINNGDFSPSSLLVSLLGAVFLLGLVNLLRRGQTV